MAALPRLEKSRLPADVQQVVVELDAWLKNPEQMELRRAFAQWLSRILLPRLAKNVPVPESMPEMNDLEEVRTILAETVEGWTREWKREGEVAMLTRLLQRRFGQLPVWVEEKIATSDSAILEEWSLRVFDARSLDEVFLDGA
ncbi:MAG: DUF4351 domain-containing protein [Magnetococcales bacterium]|nr:DUF4351 domain-containing protein [Magnetococcales bacterium]